MTEKDAAQSPRDTGLHRSVSATLVPDKSLDMAYLATILPIHIASTVINAQRTIGMDARYVAGRCGRLNLSMSAETTY